MMNCELFRDRFAPGTEDPEVLEHLRACENCLSFASQADGEMMFRGLGGGEMIPPGGIDAFVGDVMREVHLRSTEQTMAHPRLSWMKKVAIAATLALGIVGAMYYPRQQTVTIASAPRTVARVAASTATRPVIEKYDSDTATIVEMPTEGAEDVKVVMIFDEKLPADL